MMMKTNSNPENRRSITHTHTHTHTLPPLHTEKERDKGIIKYDYRALSSSLSQKGFKSKCRKTISVKNVCSCDMECP